MGGGRRCYNYDFSPKRIEGTLTAPPWLPDARERTVPPPAAAVVTMRPLAPP